MSDAEERTQQATPQRREEALKRGQAPATPEIAGVLVALCIAALLRHLPGSLNAGFTRASEPLWSAQSFDALSRGTLRLSALTPPDLFPPGFGILAMVPVAVALALLVQKGFRFMPARVGPDLSRLEPHVPWGEGADALATSLRGAARLALGFYLGFRLFGPSAPSFLASGEAVSRLAGLFAEVAGVWAVLAGADWLWRRYRFESSIMMTPAEVRAENRSSDGDPRVKSEIRSRMEASMSAGPSRRVLLREGDVVALVTIHEDWGRTPVVQLGTRGPQGDRLLAGSDRLAVPVLAVPGARLLAGARPGSAVPEELLAELADIHSRLFPRHAQRRGEAR